MLYAWWPVSSTSELMVIYTIRVYKNPDEVTCDCKSGRIRGYCKHIKFYKRLIAQLLDEKPRGNVQEKGS